MFIRGLFERDFDVPERWESVGDNVVESKKKLREQIPYLYEVGKNNTLFTLNRFLLWILNGTFHSCIIFFIPLYASEEGIITANGHTFDQWSFSIASFSSIIFIVNIKLALNTKLWNYIYLFAMLGTSIILYFVFILIYDVTTYTSSFRTVLFVIGTQYYYFSILSTVSLVCVLDVALTIMAKTYYPTQSDSIALQSMRKKNDEDETGHAKLSKDMKKKIKENEVLNSNDEAFEANSKHFRNSKSKYILKPNNNGKNLSSDKESKKKSNNASESYNRNIQRKDREEASNLGDNQLTKKQKNKI